MVEIHYILRQNRFEAAIHTILWQGHFPVKINSISCKFMAEINKNRKQDYFVSILPSRIYAHTNKINESTKLWSIYEQKLWPTYEHKELWSIYEHK